MDVGRTIVGLSRYAIGAAAPALPAWPKDVFERTSDVVWLSADRKERVAHEWTNGWVRSIGLLLMGDAGSERDAQRIPMVDDTLLDMLNAHHDMLPVTDAHLLWRLEIDTGHPALFPEERRPVRADTSHDVEGRTRLVWRLERGVVQWAADP